MPAKILLVDDHKLFTDGLQFLLGTYGYQVVGTAENGFQAFEQARLLSPDIILMDVIMPGCTGIEALKLIRTQMPAIKIVMLTTSEEDEDLFEAIRLGASGYLLKSLNGEELADMLRDLENDGAPISPKLAARLLKEFRRSHDKDITLAGKMEDETGTKLSERQIEVLEAVAGGKTYKEVGKFLGITERTVKYHMGRIIELLHLKNRAQVIAYATKRGWT
jgi:DNA-binding NarL/FixJ family response regulator